MSKKPTLSIGLPVYNGEKYIRNTLDAFLTQHSVDFELIISDNCSTDKTQDICQEYLLKDSRVKYHRNSVNVGPVANFSNIFKFASADYFMWASHDDIFVEPYIRLCIDELDHDPKCVMAGTYTQNIDQHTGEVLFVDKGVTTTGHSPLERYMMLKKVMYGGKFVNGIFYGVCRREVLEKILPLHNTINTDQLHMARVALLGDICTIPQTLLIKRTGGTSQSHKNIHRVHNLHNPLLIHCPYFMLECSLQGYIFSSSHLSLIERIQISFFSFVHYCYTYARFLYWCLQGKAKLFE